MDKSSGHVRDDFRAPPPSPIAGSRRASSVANDDVLTEFLHHSLHVPDLVLPGRLFPRAYEGGVPTVDFTSLVVRAPDASTVARDALESTGCFQLLNHGVSAHLLRAALLAAAGIFRLPPEGKKAVQRSPGSGFGFQEVVARDGEEDDDFDFHFDTCEEFVWCDDCRLSLILQQFCPNGFCNFSDKMEKLSSAIEEISASIIRSLNKLDHDKNSTATQGQDLDGSSSSVCYIYKHPSNTPVEQCISSFRYDVIRMMIRGSDCPHALSLHVCEAECSEFHVYSKKGWVSFTPTPNALIVTTGDQMQAWIGGQYKHAIGRPIYTTEQQHGNFISLAFLCSPSACTFKTFQHKLKEEENMITLQQQALFVVFFTFSCQLILFLYQNI